MHNWKLFFLALHHGETSTIFISINILSNLKSKVCEPIYCSSAIQSNFLEVYPMNIDSARCVRCNFGWSFCSIFTHFQQFKICFTFQPSKKFEFYIDYFVLTKGRQHELLEVLGCSCCWEINSQRQRGNFCHFQNQSSNPGEAITPQPSLSKANQAYGPLLYLPNRKTVACHFSKPSGFEELVPRTWKTLFLEWVFYQTA